MNDLYMKDLDEAFEFFGLTRNSTFEEIERAKWKVKSKYTKMHPDIGKIEYVEEFKKFSRLKKCIDKYVGERKYRLTKKEILEIIKEISASKDIKVMEICNKYIERLSDKTMDVTLASKIKDEFFNEIKLLIDSDTYYFYIIKDELREEIKNRYKDYLKDHSSKEETAKAKTLFLRVIKLINKVDRNEIDDLNFLIEKINFDYFDESVKILDSFDVISNIYVNRDGEVGILDKQDSEYCYLSSFDNQTEEKVTITDFKKNYINIEEFFKNSMFIGDRNIYTREDNDDIIVRSLYTSPFIYYNQDFNILVSVLKNYDDNSDNKLKFVKSDKEIIIDNSPDKTSENDIYKDKKLIYSIIKKSINLDQDEKVNKL